MRGELWGIVRYDPLDPRRPKGKDEKRHNALLNGFYNKKADAQRIYAQRVREFPHERIELVKCVDRHEPRRQIT
jgi:hypothetical protein